MNKNLTDESQSEEPEKKKNTVKSYIGTAVFFCVLILIVAFFAGFLPIAPVAVATGSMEPTIRVGDVVMVCWTDAENLEVGDIIQYRKDDYTVIHRIVECQENEKGVTEYITQGDYNNAPDSDPVTAEQIKGRVILTIPEIGNFTLWLNGLFSG